MAEREILLLGNPQLYRVSEAVQESDLDEVETLVEELHDTLMAFRRRHGAGRAIAAPQIGVMKRVICMHIDRPTVFINPVLDDMSEERMEVWDDCMCFPDLLVRVMRHETCRLRFRNLAWEEEEMRLEEAMSELLQHECDHLDGILAVSRAMDGQSFALQSQKKFTRG